MMVVLTHDAEKLMTNEARIDGAAPAMAGPATWLTVERVGYAAALCIGTLIRFWGLGRMPLLPGEAANSWPAYLAAHAQTVADVPVPTSALFYGWQWLLFWIGVNGDAGARVVGAALGSLLVLWPWTWRGWIGRGTALALAWLVAFDPWLVAFSRLADGAALGLVLGLVTLTGLMRLVMDVRLQPGARWRYVTAAAAGLLLVSGILAWSWIPVLLGFAWLYRQPLRRAGLFDRQTAVWAGLAAALGATFGLARLDGLALVGTSLGAWLAQFGTPGSYPISWPWVRLAVDEPLVAVLGIGGLAAMVLQRRSSAVRLLDDWPVFLWLWLVWGAVLCLLPGRGPLALPMIGLPLLFGAAWTLTRLASTRPRDLDWREVGAISVTLLILLVSGSFWAAALFSNRTFDPVMAQAATVIFMLTVAILVIYAVWADRRHAAWIALLVLTVLVGMATLRSGRQLNHVYEPGQVDGFFARETHPEVRLLVQDVETLSAQRTGNPYQLPVMIQVSGYTSASGEEMAALPDPILGWYLREMRRVTWSPAPVPGETVGNDSSASANSGPVVVRMTEEAGGTEDAVSETGVAMPEGYVGSVYQVEFSWLPSDLSRENRVAVEDPTLRAVERWWTPWLQPLARWVIYRAAPASPAMRDVVLWVALTTD